MHAAISVSICIFPLANCGASGGKAKAIPKALQTNLKIALLEIQIRMEKF